MKLTGNYAIFLNLNLSEFLHKMNHLSLPDAYMHKKAGL